MAGGLFTLSINYKDLGKVAGEMAVKILKGESKPADMAIEHLSTSDLVVVKNDEMAQAIGVDLSALDPKTAAKVLELTEEIISERKLTALMVTHNMTDAIRLGNRLIMMADGRVIYDVSGDEKKSLTVSDLLRKFEEVNGSALDNDRMLLS